MRPEIILERGNGIRVVLVPVLRSEEDPPSVRERAEREKLSREAGAWAATFRKEMASA